MEAASPTPTPARLLADLRAAVRLHTATAEHFGRLARRSGSLTTARPVLTALVSHLDNVARAYLGSLPSVRILVHPRIDAPNPQLAEALDPAARLAYLGRDPIRDIFQAVFIPHAAIPPVLAAAIDCVPNRDSADPPRVLITACRFLDGGACH